MNNNKWKDWCKRNWMLLAGGAAVAGYLTMTGTFNSSSRHDIDEPGATLENATGAPYSQLLNDAERRYISGVAISDDVIIATDRSGHFYTAEIPNGRDAYEDFSETNIPVTVLPDNRPGSSGAANDGGGGFPLFQVLFLGLIAASVVMSFKMMKGMGGGGGGGNAMGFAKSKGKMMTPGQVKVRFSDVAGIDEAKEELMEVVDFLKNPNKYQRLGGKMPTGLLMVGPPGTGKTLTAQAIAGEAGVPFIKTSGSEFVEMFVGVGASRVRDLFTQAKQNAPCILFIDEIDAIGKARGGGGPASGGNDEREQTLNQILVEMDGFEKNDSVIVVAATNRADVLDPALKRPGRFDRQVHVGLPDVNGRAAILQVHINNKRVPIGPDVDVNIVAQGTPGMSGADLANLVNETALIAARRNKNVVDMEDFEFARDKIQMGPERRSMVLSQEDKEMTAYHEAGHGVIGAFYHRQGLHNIPHRATIIPRGGALGLVLSLPEKDEVTHKKGKLEAMMVMAMGGKAAERIKYGEDHVSTGAGGDIQQASRIARAMVMQYGMSDLGSVDFADPSNPNQFKPTMSPEMHNAVEAEVQKMIKNAEQKAYELLKNELNPQWEFMAESLLKLETLNRDQIQKVMDMQDPTPPPPPKTEIVKADKPKPDAGNDNDPDQNSVEPSNDNDVDQSPDLQADAKPSTMPPTSGIPRVPRIKRTAAAPNYDDPFDMGPS